MFLTDGQTDKKVILIRVVCLPFEVRNPKKKKSELNIKKHKSFNVARLEPTNDILGHTIVIINISQQFCLPQDYL